MESDIRKDLQHLAIEVVRDDSGKFVKGSSGNPAGRPKGARNKATLLREKLDDVALGEVAREYIDVIHAMIRAAKQGNVAAARFIKEIADIANDEGETAGKGKAVTVVIENFTVESAPKPIDVIDGEIIDER